MANYTLQLLHYYGESGLLGVLTAPIMGALIDKFDDQYANTLVLAEGDSYIPGPWLIGGADPALNGVAGIGATALGRPDIAIMNAFGTDASALGNHEFDLGSAVLQGAIAPSGTWSGAQFPFITANLDFTADSSLRGLADGTIGGTATNSFAGKEASTIKGKIAPYTVVTQGSEKIGIVGLTTYDLLSKSSPNGTVPKDDANPATSDLQEVAVYIQAAVNALKAAGINKIVMVDQLDTIERNKQLAPLVSGIDVMIAGGGHERLGDATDKAVAFNGHNADFVGTYPIVTAGADGKPTLIVTTDTEYTYLGRLVVDFDENGEIVLPNLNPVINGAYAANEASLQAAYGTTQTANQIVAGSTIGTQVSAITKAIDTVISTKDSNIFGYTNVYLEGDRAFGRAEEVNLGDISADANLFVARKALGADAVLASLKNGGGLRSSIGSIGEKGEKLPPTATGVKTVGAISQLDIENALRFDNKLMVFDTTPQGLLNILNYAAGLAPGNGGYAQIGGVRFSYDPSKAADKKVQDVAIYDLNGKLVAKVADNGVLLPDAPAKIAVSVLNFTANGGDGYPIKANATNFRYILDNGTLSAAIDSTLDFTAATSLPANALGEQKAFQDYLKANYPTPQRAYSVADTPATQDQRIQNLQVKKEDTILPALTTPISTVAAGKPKTVLISLDGATNTILKEYLKNGVLDPTKGLGLLASKGVIASGNQTITPSLTAPSHIAIATGSTAVDNDINANSFHLIANPFATNTSGFAAPIGGYNYQSGIDPSESNTPTANPIWLGLEKAGKTVVSATFPGADGVNITAAVKTSNGSPIVLDKAADRTVDYTVPFGAFGGPFFTGGSGGRGFSLTAADFTVDKTQAVNGLTALGRKFYGDVKVATLESLTATALTGGNPAYNLQVAAIDTTDDSKVNYDTLVVFDANVGIKGATSLPATGSAFIKVSDQKSTPFYFEGSTNKVGTSFFGATLAADLSTVNLARYSAYYIPRPAESPGVVANVDDINNSTGFWAAQADFRFPERLNVGLAKFSDAELEALYADQVKSFVEYQTKVAVRSIQQNPNADLVLTYIEQPDGSEHQFLLTDPRQASDFTNPNSIGAGQDAAKVARYKTYIENAYKAADAAVQKIIETVGVDANGKPNSNIIVTSDHGFAPFHTAVSLNNLFTSNGLDSTKVRAVTSGPATNIYINVKGREPNGTVDPKDYAALQKQVIDILNAYTDSNPNYQAGGTTSTKVFDKVYNRQVPANPTANDIINARGNFIGEDTGDVFALLKEGYNFDGTQATPVIRKGDTTSTTPILSVPNFYGAHGYDPTSPAMQAIFLAAGPDIANKDLGQVNNIDIAPTIDKLLGVKPASTVDGKALDIFATKPVLPKLTLLGQATYAAQSVTVKDAAGVDTTVGGLSGITYDAKTNSFYSISDDRKSNANEPGQPTRFYKLNIDLTTGKLDNSKVAFTSVTYLRKADGSQYLPQSTDTEDIGLTKAGTIFVSSEGQVDVPGQIRTFPFVNEYNLADGKLLRALPIPAKFQPDSNLAASQTRGVYDNLGFESIAVTPDQKTLFTGGENALAQDGQRTSFPGTDPKNPTGVGRSRLIKFNLDTNKAAAEYLYNLDPTAAAPSVSTTGANNFATAGLVALTALDNNGNMLAIERSFSSVAANTPLTPETGNVIKIYQISVSSATDISGIDSLNALSSADLGKIKPVQKQLLLNLNDLKLPTGLDNIEGITFGPTVNGKPTIVLVADDNFNKTGSTDATANTANQPQFTQIIALSLDTAAAFPNGVASGDTTQNSTVLWTRAANLGDVTFEYSTTADFATIAGTKTVQATNALQPVKVEVTGLNPNTEYYYRAIDSLGSSLVGKFSTAAPLNTFTGLKFGVSGDWRGELAPYSAISNVPTANLKFFVEHGDTIYGDVATPALLNADGTEKQQATTLDDYRIKHAEVYGSRFGKNSFADLRASTSIFATYDDHEVTNDFAGGAPISSDNGGAKGANRFLAAFPNDNPNALINDSALFENGLQAFQEYNPIQDKVYNTPSDSRTNGERKIYRYNTFGSDAATFVLDARSFRDTELAPVTNTSDTAQVGAFLAKSFDTSRTMLGRQQVQDLKNDLLNAKNNGVTWKFIMVPEPIENIGILAAEDRFEGYAAERTEILKFINDNKINNVVFVAADFHGTLVNNLTYQTAPGGPQIATSAFEIITGAVAYDKPFGPTVAELAAAVGLLTPAQKAQYDGLPDAGKDAFIKGIVNGGLAPLGYDPVGLDNNLTQANGLIDAKLLKGDYVATNTYGWTEFNIDKTTQKLTVTTYGVPAYSRAQIEADPTKYANQTPAIVSQFEVNAKSAATDTVPPAVKAFSNLPGISIAKPIDGVVVEFSEALKAGTFDFNDISLKKDGGANLITSAVTVVKQSDTKYQINGLAALTTALGSYELTVDGANIVDPAGNAGTNSLSAKFTVAPALTNPEKYLDLREKTGTVAIDSKVSADAAYFNYGGFYTIDDANGTVTDSASGKAYKPSDLGYATAALKRAVVTIAKTESSGSYQLASGQLLAPYLVAEGNITDFINNNPTNAAGNKPHAYFNFVDANPDTNSDGSKVVHVQSSILANGTKQYAFEDFFGGGDRDFNDFVLQLNLKA